jgi:hypothetical protein
MNSEDNIPRKPSIFRTKFIIMPSFQWKIIVQGVILSFAIVLSTRLIEKFFIVDLLDSHIALETDPARFIEHIRELQNRLQFMFMMKSLIVILVISFWGMVLSHRIAGPIYRIKKSLDDFTQKGGELKIKFRLKDNFHELAESINQAFKRK